MVGLLELPMELFLDITNYIDTGRDWKNLAAVDRNFNRLAIKRFWDGLDTDKKHRVLMWSCAAGSTRALRRLLESGLTANLELQVVYLHELKDEAPAFYIDTPSQRRPGLGAGDYAFIPHMADIHQVDAYSAWVSFWMPLHVAVRHGQAQIIEILLQHGAWIDAPSVNYCLCKRSSSSWGNSAAGEYTALHLAICTGQEEIAQLLISKGASIYVDGLMHRDKYSYGSDLGRVTALHFCAKHGLLSTARAIVEDEAHKRVLHDRDEYGWSAIMYAYRYFKDDVFDYLLAEGAGTQIESTVPCWTDTDFVSAASELLHQACLDGRWETMVKLVNHGSDPSKPDVEGTPPLQLCLFTTRGRHYHKRFRSQPVEYQKDSDDVVDWLRRFRFRSFEDWEDPDDAVEVPEMIDAIKACGMHLKARKDTLINVMKYALVEPIPALASLILDAGIDSLEVIETGRCEAAYAPQLPTSRLGSEAFDWDFFYLNTGMYATHSTLLDYACYESHASPELPELLKLLFSRGCMDSGDTSSYIRALENLCCNPRFEHRWDVQSDCQENASCLERGCAQILCGQLGIALQRNPTTMRLPFELFFICFREGDYIILEELAKVVTFSDTSFSVEELQYLFDTLTERGYWGVNDPLFNRRLRCSKFLFRLGGSDALLQRSESFEALFYFVRLEYAEEAIVHYLDIGGQYRMVLHHGRTDLYEACTYGCLQLVQRLLDLGADPNRLLVAPKNPDAMKLPTVGAFWGRPDVDGALLRLLLDRGGNPFRPDEENYGIGYPFEVCLESESMFEFFCELCRLTINENTNKEDLADILALACSRGKYLHVQELRSCGGNRVDAIIGENGVRFLQELLVNLSPSGGKRFWHTTTFRQVDHAISSIGLIHRIGGSGILTSSWREAKKEENTNQRRYGLQEWRDYDQVGKQENASWKLGKDIDDYSSLEFLKKLLTRPKNPVPLPKKNHLTYYEHVCESDYLQSTRIYWCLNQRIKIGSGSDTDSVTILDERIKRPSEMEGESLSGAFTLPEEQEGYLDEIFVCHCEWQFYRRPNWWF
ncbi:ankyrin repeat-containing domain protein [Apiospora marii]|uniref:Ankyrin repeat-containing domain protein n=1 Tax=Apiospora marii TaxID=335849 RepID=A0ABR1RVW2_9PEZI